MDRKDFLKSLPLLTLAIGTMDLNKLGAVPPSGEQSKMPVLFIGHGSPMNAIADNDFTKALNKTGRDIKAKNMPKAILVVSAHWLTQGTYACVSPNPKTIYDFGGFADELYQIKYHAPGAPELAKEVARIQPIKEDNEWGLDHGAWTILKHLFPEHDIPVFQLSIDYNKPMQYHFNLAQQLDYLRKRGVLIIGSGNIVHNLHQQFRDDPYDWNIEFDEWIRNKINNREFNDIINYENMGRAAKLSVPTPDHYIPLLYCLPLAAKEEEIAYIYEGFELGIISMRALKIG